MLSEGLRSFSKSRCARPSSQLSHHPEMRSNSAGHGRKFVIIDIELLAGLLYDLTDRRIMHMTYAGKQMMFYLEI